MNLYYFLLVIISLSCGSLPSAGPEIDVVRSVFATIAMVIGWSMLSHVGARVVSGSVAAGEIDPLDAAAWIEKQLSMFRWLGLGVVVMCLAGFGLSRMIDEMPYFSDSMFLQAIVLLAPGLAIVFSTWSAEHYYGVRLGYTDRSLPNYLRSVSVAFRGSLAWLVIPVLILLALGDLLALLPVDEAITQWLSLGAIVLFVTVGLPRLMRYLFKTEPIGEEFRQWIESLLQSAGVQGTRPVRWDTNHRAYNAMVAGFLPSCRSLLLSDRLLDELPRDQVAMVVLHEAAHLRRKHVPLRMLSVLPAWAAGAALTNLAGENEWAMILGSIVGILLTLVMLRIVAYRTEYDADVQACRLAVRISGQVEGVPDSHERAADALSRALMRVTFDQPNSRKATWLHPGIAERIDLMRRVLETPQISSATAGTIANPA